MKNKKNRPKLSDIEKEGGDISSSNMQSKISMPSPMRKKVAPKVSKGSQHTPAKSSMTDHQGEMEAQLFEVDRSILAS
jgi:hypothetical protein